MTVTLGEPYTVLGEAFPYTLRRLLDIPAYWLILHHSHDSQQHRRRAAGQGLGQRPLRRERQISLGGKSRRAMADLREGEVKTIPHRRAAVESAIGEGTDIAISPPHVRC